MASPAPPNGSAVHAARGTRVAGTTESGAAASVAGVGAVVAATVSWTAGTVIINLIDASVFWILLWRFVLALPIALVLLFWRGGRRGLRDLGRAWPGGVAFALHVLVNFAALQTTSVAIVTFLIALQPILVMLVARRAFGERITPLMVGCALVAIGGVALVIAGTQGGGKLETTAWGLGLAIANVFLWTAYFLISKRLRESVDALSYQGSVLVVGTIMAVPITFVFAPGDSDVVGGLGWLFVGLLAVVPTTGHLLMNWAHRFVAASISSLIVLTLPVLASIAAAMFLDQPFGPLQAAGGLLAVIATGIVVYRSTRPAELETEWD